MSGLKSRVLVKFAVSGLALTSEEVRESHEGAMSLKGGAEWRQTVTRASQSFCRNCDFQIRSQTAHARRRMGQSGCSAVPCSMCLCPAVSRQQP